MTSFLDPQIESYVLTHTARESAVLAELARETRARCASAQMLSGPLVGAALRFLAEFVDARRILEVGTFTGYSALWMAAALPESGELITCDVDEETTAIARRAWARAPEGGRISLRLGPALETMRALEAPFDMVFLDADKESILAYYEEALRLLRPGGIVVADNVFWDGRVVSDPDGEASTRALVAFAGRVSQDERVSQLILPFRDGLLVARRRRGDGPAAEVAAP